MAKKKSTKKLKGEAKSGALYAVAILGIVAAFGGVMAGGVIPSILHTKTPPNQNPLYTCCDSGDGANCHPILEKQLTYNGDAYALLKSNIAQGEAAHMAPTNSFSPEGNRIFINTSDTSADYGSDSNFPGCDHGKDLIGLNDPTKEWGGCFGIPNDELIYVCKDNQVNCNQLIKNSAVPFDVYYRLKDGPVPAEIANYCPKPKGVDANSSPQEIIGVPTPGGRKNLQLEWFQVKQEKQLYDWLGAWCKPAINLYPTEKTNVHVEVAPQGKFLLTIPQYPKGGWDVTAYPNGSLTYQNKPYPYLYWEASLPDKLITQPKEGYVVAYKELPELFTTILPDMGLSGKETMDFKTYWLKALPKSPYYFVGVMPESQINSLAPLTIQPAPDSLLRVSLYFKALEQKESVTPPQLSEFKRDGFTVTEWGGFFKADKNHPDFTCVM